MLSQSNELLLVHTRHVRFHKISNISILSWVVIWFRCTVGESLIPTKNVIESLGFNNWKKPSIYCQMSSTGKIGHNWETALENRPRAIWIVTMLTGHTAQVNDPWAGSERHVLFSTGLNLVVLWTLFNRLPSSDYSTGISHFY